MNDITKMRSELEEKIRIAEMENEYERQLEGTGLRLSIFSKDGERYLASVRKVDDSWRNPFNEHDAQTILRMFPKTDDIRTYVGNNKYEMLPYRMETERVPREPRTKLKIHYIHENLVLWIELPINEQNPELMQYFTRDQRVLDNDTIGLYFGAVSPQEKSRLQMLPFLTFNSGRVVRFQGGCRRQISVGHIECVIASIENDDFAWERETE